MKIELDIATINVIATCLRMQQAVIEAILQNLQAQVNQANQPPANVSPIRPAEPEAVGK